MFFSELSERERRDIFERHWSVGDIRAQTVLSLYVLMSHQADQKVFEAVSEHASEKSLF